METARRQQGFTMIELLITLAIASVLLAGICTTFISQRKVYAVREQVAEMQQGIRVAMELMLRDLSMAGYDPTGTAGAGIVAAGAASIQFTMDLTGNGDTADADEHVTYALYDAEGDGDQDLARNAGAGNQLMAENIESLAFVYTLADDSTTQNPADPSQIRTIQITLTGRTAVPDPQHSMHNGYRTRSLTSTVKIRNMGL